MKFSEIVGLEEIKQRLLNTLKSGKIAHAQLFSSIAGGAALPIARAYAALINCENPIENDSCGSCPSCTKIYKNIHPDVHFIFPVSATKDITGTNVISKSFMEQWRDFLANDPYGTLTEWANCYGGEDKQALISRQESREILKDLTLKSFEAKYKVMIIWLPEYMHSSASNSILKILEEPPGDTVFLLVSNHYQQLQATILSRVQMVRIRPFSTDEVLKFLEYNNYDLTRSEEIAAVSNGSLNQAIRLSTKLEDDNSKSFMDWMRYCYKSSYGDLVSQSDEFARRAKLSQQSLLDYGLSVFRESIFVNLQNEKLASIQTNNNEFVKDFSKALTFKKLDKLNSEFEKAFTHLERNANPRLLFMDLSITVSKILVWK